MVDGLLPGAGWRGGRAAESGRLGESRVEGVGYPATWIASTIRDTLWLGSVLGLLALAISPAWAVGLVLGAGWNALNLWLWSRLLAAVVRPGPRTRARIGAAFILKFPVLFGGGYLLLVGGRLDPVSVLVGVSLPLATLTLNAVGRSRAWGAAAGAVWSADRPPQGSAGHETSGG